MFAIGRGRVLRRVAVLRMIYLGRSLAFNFAAVSVDVVCGVGFWDLRSPRVVIVEGFVWQILSVIGRCRGYVLYHCINDMNKYAVEDDNIPRIGQC